MPYNDYSCGDYDEEDEDIEEETEFVAEDEEIPAPEDKDSGREIVKRFMNILD